MRRTLVALGTTASLTVGGLILLAPDTAQADPKLSQSQKDDLKQSGHITVIRKDRTVLVQRGQITALTATSLTLRSPDGFTHSYVLTAATKVKGKGVTAVGQRAQVVAVHTDKGDNARRLRHGFRQAS